MKLSDRLPPIPFEGNWRWKVKPHSDTHVKLCLQRKPAAFWLTYASVTVDPFEKMLGFTVERRAEAILEFATHKLIRNTTQIVSYKDGTKNAR